MRGSHFAACLAAACCCPMMVSAGTIRDDHNSRSYLCLAAQPQFAAVGRIAFHTDIGDVSGDIRISRFDGWVGQAINSVAALSGSAKMTVAVPEPSSGRLACFAALAAGLGLWQRRRRWS